MAGVNEAHFREIERTLLYVSEARKRAKKTAKELRRDGAEPHLVEAVDEAERKLEEVGRHLISRRTSPCRRNSSPSKSPSRN
jgi:hypothetical protein